MSSLAYGAAKALAGPDRVSILDAQGNVMVLFHTSMSEEYNHKLTVTDFPVEGGAAIADHLLPAGFLFTFKGIISDTPLDTQAANVKAAGTAAVGNILPPLGVAAAGAAYGLADSYANSPAPCIEAYNELVRLQSGLPKPKEKTQKQAAAQRLLTVRSRLGVWKSMVIENLTAPRGSDISGAIEFSITFKKISIVRPQSVEVGKFGNPGLAAARGNLGDQSATVDGFTPGRVLSRDVMGEPMPG